MDAEQPDDVQLPYLETFSKVAEMSSFTGAARALRLTQASVSQRVQALEKSLGTSLFKRQGGRVLLRAVARARYPHAPRLGARPRGSRGRPERR